MKSIFILSLAFIFSTGCSTKIAKIDSNELQSVKKIAVIIFALRKSIEHRDTPYEDDSDLAAFQANALSYGEGVIAANFAFPEFINELNKQNLPFKVLTLEEMKSNNQFMKLYKPPTDLDEDNMFISFFTASAYARSPAGFMNFGMPERYNINGSALTGQKGEMDYIKQAMELLKVDAALIIVDRGTSFQCNMACIMGNGDASMGAAFHSILIKKNGKKLFKLNHTFEGDAHAIMYKYSIISFLREHLYKQHGIKMAQEYSRLFKEKL